MSSDSLNGKEFSSVIFILRCLCHLVFAFSGGFLFCCTKDLWKNFDGFFSSCKIVMFLFEMVFRFLPYVNNDLLHSLGIAF